MKRALLVCLAIGLISLTSCRRPLSVVRLGYSPDLPNAAALAGVETGRFASVDGVPVRAVIFNTGTTAIEPLLSRDLDAAYMDPVSAILAFVKSEGDCVIVAGAATGGSALVASKKSRARKPEDLKESTVVTPHLASTQDVAARMFFGTLGFVSYEHGGGFQMSSISNQDLLPAMTVGGTEAAWTVEPWVTQLVAQGGGRVLIDEATLWAVAGSTPSYPTAVLVVRRALLKAHPAVITDLVRTHLAVTQWIRENPAPAQAAVLAAIVKAVGPGLSADTLARAWPRVTLDTAIPTAGLAKNGDDAARLGFIGLEPVAMARLVADEPLKRATNPQPGS